MTESCCMILTTVAGPDEAGRLAELLVSRHLAACVQIAPITSWYRWKGEVAHEAEQLLLIKTTAERYPQVEAAIVENHPYEVPEVVQVPIVQGLRSYLEWLGESTQ